MPSTKGGGLSIRSYLVFGKNLTPGAGSLTQNMHEISCAVRGSELDDPAYLRTLGTEKTYEITIEITIEMRLRDGFRSCHAPTPGYGAIRTEKIDVRSVPWGRNSSQPPAPGVRFFPENEV